MAQLALVHVLLLRKLRNCVAVQSWPLDRRDGNSKSWTGVAPRVAISGLATVLRLDLRLDLRLGANDL